MEIKQKQEKSKEEERIVRILSQDIEGKTSIYAGLAQIKGVSWSMSNAICHALKFDRYRKIGSLTDEEVKKISGSTFSNQFDATKFDSSILLPKERGIRRLVSYILSIIFIRFLTA